MTVFLIIGLIGLVVLSIASLRAEWLDLSESDLVRAALNTGTGAAFLLAGMVGWATLKMGGGHGLAYALAVPTGLVLFAFLRRVALSRPNEAD